MMHVSACLQSAGKDRRAYSPLAHADSISAGSESDGDNNNRPSNKTAHSRWVLQQKQYEKINHHHQKSLLKTKNNISHSRSSLTNAHFELMLTLFAYSLQSHVFESSIEYSWCIVGNETPMGWVSCVGNGNDSDESR